MLSPEQEALILRLATVEKWPPGTISSQLGVHHDAVERVLRDAGMPAKVYAQRPSMADPFLPFIIETLKKYPKICASRVFQMVRERGYPGGPDHFRAIVRGVRPHQPPEAFLRLKTLPAEQAQVDWAHFGYVTIGKAQRALMAFVMVLSWCRMVFLKFYLNAQAANLLRGHEDAFRFFGGVPRVALYDNPKNVVLERIGDAVRFHPMILGFASHHRYEPRPVAPRRGNEKGRVERGIRYVRTSFWPARKWTDLDDLNRQALAWCCGEAADRKCQADLSMTVREAFVSEQGKLRPLPENPYPTDERVEVVSGKTPYIRFDLNDYSIPHEYVRKTLVAVASLERVRVLDGNSVIADHRRSFDKGEQIEEKAHIDKLIAQKRRAREHRGLDRLQRQVSNAADLLQLVASRGGNLGSVTATLLRYVDEYTAAAVEQCIAEAIQRETPHLSAVRFLLEKRRRALGRPVPIPVELPDDPRVRDLSVRPHALETYDEIEEVTQDGAARENSNGDQ
jgi:transposase